MAAAIGARGVAERGWSDCQGAVDVLVCTTHDMPRRDESGLLSSLNGGVTPARHADYDSADFGLAIGDFRASWTRRWTRLRPRSAPFRVSRPWQSWTPDRDRSPGSASG